MPDLQSLVSSGDHNTLRLAAAQALGHLGEPGLDALASLLRGADEDTRILAVFGIAESGTLGDSLRREASTNASARVRLAERVARPEVSIPIRVAPRYVPQPASAKMEPTRISFVDFSGVSTQELAQNLAKPDRQGIVAAADELGRRGPEGIQVLRRHVAGPNRFASAAAIAALSRAGKDATPAVPRNLHPRCCP